MQRHRLALCSLANSPLRSGRAVRNQKLAQAAAQIEEVQRECDVLGFWPAASPCVPKLILPEEPGWNAVKSNTSRPPGTSARPGGQIKGSSTDNRVVHFSKCADGVTHALTPTLVFRAN